MSIAAPDLLDIIEAQERRDHGHARVLSAEPWLWTQAAEGAIADLAASGRPFTSDDVCAIVGRPLHGNAVGAVFRRAVASGALRRAEGMQQSERPAARERWLARYVGVHA